MPDVVLPSPMPLPCLTQLRQETASRLRTLPGVFKGVYDSRLPQLKRELLPAVRVYTSSAQPRAVDQHPRFPHDGAPGRPDHLRGQHRRRARRAHRRYCEIVKDRLLSDGDWLQLFERVLAIDTEFDRSVEGEWRLTTATIDLRHPIHRAPGSPYVPDWLETVHLQVDVIDPAADPNTGEPGTPPNVEGGYPGGYPGPDGRSRGRVRSRQSGTAEGWTPPPATTRDKGS